MNKQTLTYSNPIVEKARSRTLLHINFLLRNQDKDNPYIAVLIYGVMYLSYG